MQPQKTFIDWLKFRTKTDHYKILEALKPNFYAGEELRLGAQEQGRDGWTYRRSFYLVDERIGSVDYGGESQRDWVRVDLSGSACRWVKDWYGMSLLVDQLDSAELRRVDIALDVFDGSVNIDSVLREHKAGGFDRGGRRPKERRILSEDQSEGWTVYIGSRDSSRFVRVYGKGWELLDKTGAMGMVRTIPGWRDAVFSWDNGEKSKAGDYVRMEAEFKPSDGFVLPWTMLTTPDQFFAGIGSYFASQVDSRPLLIQSMPSQLFAKLSNESAMYYATMQVGSLLALQLQKRGDTDANRLQIFRELLGDKTPTERLVEAGVLML